MAEGDLPHRFELSATDLQGHDRPHPLRHLHRGDALLPERHLSATPPRAATPACCARVATDGHRLARVEMPLPEGAAGMPGVIVPRKTVSELRKLIDESDGSVEVELSDTKIRFAFGDVDADLSKLIDGTFPDYERVIPTGNDKVLERAVQASSPTPSTASRRSRPRSRAPSSSRVAKGSWYAVGHQPGAGSATEEIEVEYDGRPLEIGFNSRYLLDITEQIEGDEARSS